VPGAGDSVDARIERLIEHNTHVTISPGTGKAGEQERKKTRDCSRAENLSYERSSRDEPTSDEGDPTHSKIPLDGTWLEWEHWPQTCAPFLQTPWNRKSCDAAQ